MAALSSTWDGLSADHKIVFLLESLANAPHQQSPIACRVCDKIFFDNTSLLEHFVSHFNDDGSLKGGRQRLVETNSAAQYPNLSLGHGTFGAQPHQPSNFHARFAGRQHPRVPIRPTVSTNEQSNYNFRLSDRGTGRWHRRTRRNAAEEGASSSYTRPYIKLLERPVQQTILVVEDNNPNDMDLTLKL